MDLSDLAGSGSNAKDFGKKKRGNRYAKLKQTKLDVRREQWLAQVKSKGCKEESETAFEGKIGGMDVKNVELEEVKVGGEEKKGLSQQSVYWDLSPSNSPGSFGSLLASNSSGAGFSGSSDSSGGCFSGSVTEEEEEENDDDCLDDWEAVADALGVGDKRMDARPDLELPVRQKEQTSDLSSEGNSIGKGTRPESLKLPESHGVCRAWKPDDTFRPQSLPNLTKQYSCPVNSDMHYDRGCGSWVSSNLMSVPSSCPICYEDLDITDTSFLPCLCGFRLCLFCHKRILEEDGRCPGCRKPYDKNGYAEDKSNLNGGTPSIHFARSFSMVAGSRK